MRLNVLCSGILRIIDTYKVVPVRVVLCMLQSEPLSQPPGFLVLFFFRNVSATVRHD